MRININRDIEEYKDEFAWGFTLRELGYAVLSVAIIFCAGFGIWFLFKPYPVICVYCAIPFGVPTMILGFYKKQGMTIFQYWKEIRYQKKTGRLCYEAGELKTAPYVWSMKREHGQKGKKK